MILEGLESYLNLRRYPRNKSIILVAMQKKKK